MFTRIRYAATGKNLKTSIKPIQADGRQVAVVLDEKKFHFMIQDFTTKEVISFGGDTKNPNVLKLQAKKALEDLGVVFQSENRNRGSKVKDTKRGRPRHEAPTTQNEVMAMVEERLSKFLKTDIVQLIEAHKTQKAI